MTLLYWSNKLHYIKGDYNPVQAHVQDPSYYKTGEVMQSFSEVCVAAVISVVTVS